MESSTQKRLFQKLILAYKACIYLKSTLNVLQNGVYKILFSLGHFVIFSRKPENCEIPEGFREKPS